MKSLLKKISGTKKNIGSSLFDSLIRSIIKLSLVPFYIKFLGLDLYSEWIILISISSLFEFSNFGLNQAITNFFSLNLNKREYKNAFDSINVGFTAIFFLWFLITIVISLLKPLYPLLNFNLLSTNEVFIIVELLNLRLFCEMIGGLFSSNFIAHDKKHKIIILKNINFILESIIIFLLVYLKFNLKIVALGYIFPSILLTLYLIYQFKNKLNYQFKFQVNSSLLRSLLKPGISFSLLSLNNLIFNHVLLVLIKSKQGSIEVVIFNTCKLIFNYIVKFQGILLSSIAPRIIILYSEGKNKIMNQFLKKSNKYLLYTTIIILFIVTFFNEIIWNFLTNNELKIDNLLFFGFLFIGLIRSFYKIKSVFLEATNNHFLFSIIAFILTAITAIIIAIFNFSISYIILPIIIIELLQLLILEIIIKKNYRWLIETN